MSQRVKCGYCGRDAIGFQGFGCGAAFVCADHAEPALLELRPGQRKIAGDCVYEWYAEQD